jgi:osmotically-inducible protein OsmY
MKTLIATLFATAAGAAFAAPTVALNHDPASYRAVTQKAAADYKAATAKCGSMSGNDKDVCMAEAKLTRTRTEAKALSQYNNNPTSREKARSNMADAEYDLAKAKCGAKSGADKDDCMNTAKSEHTAALADAKSGANATASNASGASGAVGASAAGSAGSDGGLVDRTNTRDPAKSAAVDKCAQQGGDSKTGCLVQTKSSSVKENAGEIANRTETAADRAGDKTAAAASTAAAKTKDAAATAADKTKDVAATAAEKTKAVAATAAEKTKEVAHTAVEKTKQLGATVAQKTENAADRAGDNTRQAANATAEKTDNTLDKAGDKTKDAATSTKLAASDTAITTKVKAGLVKEPDLESLGIHVETEKGVVMLSGFVNSKAEADKAVKVAKGVDGVTTVKSAIKVK